jgi:hypothetical protein
MVCSSCRLIAPSELAFLSVLALIVEDFELHSLVGTPSEAPVAYKIFEVGKDLHSCSGLV